MIQSIKKRKDPSICDTCKVIQDQIDDFKRSYVINKFNTIELNTNFENNKRKGIIFASSTCVWFVIIVTKASQTFIKM